MEKVYDVGEQVLIFPHGHYDNFPYDPYIEGVIIEHHMSDDLAYHGSPWTVEIYQVLGNDGKKYWGNYADPVLGDSYFLTREHYMTCLENSRKRLQKELTDFRKKTRMKQAKIDDIMDHLIQGAPQQVSDIEVPYQKRRR